MEGGEHRVEEAPSAEALRALVARGARTLVLPLHAAHAEAHEWVAGRPGDFAASLRALGAARAQGLAVRVETWLTRSNARVLDQLPALLRARGVSAWTLVVPRYEDDAALTGRAARLSLALPSALAALSRARTLGLDVSLEGAPLCLLGPFAAQARHVGPRAFGPRCEGCAARPRCPGIDASYLARFGDGEVRAIAG